MKLKHLLCAGLAALCAGSGAHAESFDEIIARQIKAMEDMQDNFYATYGPLTYNRQAEDAYTRWDARFAEVIDRLTVRYLADPKQRATYASLVERGNFRGSEEDYARLQAVNWLHEPLYGRYDPVEYPDNYSNGEAIYKAWQAAGPDNPGEIGVEALCSTGWAQRMPIPELARMFEQATAAYYDWAKRDRRVWEGFNPYNAQFIDAASEEAFFRESIARWLFLTPDGQMYPHGCVKTQTNFDTWLDWTGKNPSGREPVSGATTPEE